MKVGEYCNREVVVINGTDSVKAAAELMRTHHVGDLVLLGKESDKSIPIGIITDRDLVVEVMATGVSPDSLSVRDLLTESISVISENDSLFDALDLMRSKKIRRLPVVNYEKALVGIITIDDIIDILTEMLSQIVSVIKIQSQKEAKQRV